MINELQVINEIQQLLEVSSKKTILIRTDIAAIIPDGCEAAYSTNVQGQVDGIKISADCDSIRLLNLVAKFEHLERLVFFPKNTIKIPPQIAKLVKLRFISLDRVESLPRELFRKKLSFYPRGYKSNYNRPQIDSTQHLEKLSSRLRLFKLLNPNIEIPVTEYELFNGKHFNAENVPFGVQNELDLFCFMGDIERKKILGKKGIFIENFVDIKDPPFVVLNQGIDAVNRYFQEKDKQGTEKLYEAKIVIVGAGESGKTTLIRKLQDPNHPVPNAEDKRTEGIRVTAYPFQGITKDGIKDIQAHIWDFGGQELYHTTHQLFLTPDTLYILLNDNRKNDTDFYYWLNIVTIRAGENNPILMVFNAKDNAARQIVPGEEIYSTFPNLIKEGIDVNFADTDLADIHKMKQTIEEYFTCLDVLGKTFPAYWVKVREKLTMVSEEYISWEKFAEICEENGIKDVSQMQLLAITLHNLGVLLYFPKVFGLGNLVILKSQWCIDAIYSALDTKEIIRSGGRFNEHALAEKWAGKRFAGNHLQLLKIMQHFDLCYKIDGTAHYIAPQLLPILENRLKQKRSDWEIVFHFDYTFMPAGFITRLIARMSLFIKTPYVWRNGVTLEWENETIAEIIEHQLTQKIEIKIKGHERKRRLLDIRKCLYDLQSDFRGLKFKESVACNCNNCVKGGEVTTFELNELEDDAEHNDYVTCRNGTRKKIAAKDILEGISYDDFPRILISYSHRNENFKDEFRTMIAPMESENKWKVWDDRWLLPGDNWNKEIIKHLNEANVIVLMLTADFFISDFINDIELARAIQRHESGDALIIGIVVSDCMWEETPLSKIQILPKDGVPIDRHTHRNEVWKIVANKIKESILVSQGKGSRKGGWAV